MCPGEGGSGVRKSAGKEILSLKSGARGLCRKIPFRQKGWMVGNEDKEKEKRQRNREERDGLAAAFGK